MRHGELIAGRYELIRRLGRGGMGEVWVGRDQALKREIALKALVLDGETLTELPLRFEREAIAVAQINHPNVVAMYDRGVHEDILFLVMEKVDGETLADLLGRQGALDPALALDIAEAICVALIAAHQARVIHYDIKPHNVMLTRDGHVKVVDFGIAGLSRTMFTLARSSELTPAGTPEYGAPEQFLTERGDERSDLYALGGVLFAMLAGRPPFTGHNALAIIRHKLDEDAPRLDSLRPGLPSRLTDLVAALLERDPAQRPQSARDVHSRLRELRTTHSTPKPPTQSSRPDPDHRLGHERQRSRRGWTIALAVLAALGALGGGYAGYRWTQDQYYVGAEGGHVAVYQGVNRNLVGLSLSSVHAEYQDIELKYLPKYEQAQVTKTFSVDSLNDADATIRDLDAWARLCKRVSDPNTGSVIAQPSRVSPDALLAAPPTPDETTHDPEVAASTSGASSRFAASPSSAPTVPGLTDNELARAKSCPEP
ncbi:serine/threonine-protein kinase [Streptomyces rubellomurinus]|uniref:serine/threonine-protein kinase n=1 Tax=Streptomyces rubellomurinus (strain ATCC 31215) TaxID=359131 RepID=UPI000698F60D|nr:serine/threonine-protein kinase [Streptomyces rubellomurinus]